MSDMSSWKCTNLLLRKYVSGFICSLCKLASSFWTSLLGFIPENCSIAFSCDLMFSNVIPIMGQFVLI